MKKGLLALIIAPMLLLYGCGSAQSGEKVLSPEEFKQKISETEAGIVLDVRTQAEGQRRPRPSSNSLQAPQLR